MRKEFDIVRPGKKAKHSLAHFYSDRSANGSYYEQDDRSSNSSSEFNTPFFDVYEPSEVDTDELKNELKKNTAPNTSLSTSNRPATVKPSATKIKPKADDEKTTASTERMSTAEMLKHLKDKKDAQKKSYLQYMALKRQLFRTVKSSAGRKANNLLFREIESTMKSQRIDWGTLEFVSLVKSYFPDAALSVTQQAIGGSKKPTAQEEADKQKENQEFMKDELSVATDNYDLKAKRDSEGRNVLETDEGKQEKVDKEHRSTKDHKLKTPEKVQATPEEKDPALAENSQEPTPEIDAAEAPEEAKAEGPTETPEIEPVDNSTNILEKNKEPLPKTETKQEDPEALQAEFEARKAGLVEQAATVRQNINQNLAQQKEAMAASFAAQVAAANAQYAAKQAALKSNISSARKQVEASFTKATTDAKATLEKETQNTETVKTKRLAALAEAVANKKTEFGAYISKKESEPEAFAKQEGTRIQSELEEAAKQCIQQGNKAAARFGEKEEKEAAMKVGMESANDIRAKIAPMQQDILKLGVELKGNYTDYKTKVFDALDQNETQLKPIIEKKAADTISSLQQEHDALVAQLEKAKTSSLASLDAMLSQGISSLDKQKASSISGLRKSKDAGVTGLGTIASTLLKGVDLVEQDTLSSLGGAGDPYMPGVNALVDDAIGRLNTLDSECGSKMSEQVASMEQLMQDGVSSFATSSQQLVESTSTNASSLQSEVIKKNESTISEFATNAAKKVTALDSDSQTAIDSSMTQIETEIVKVKEKIDALNTEAKEKITAKTSENLEKAKMPLHDQTYDRAVKAGEEVHVSFWDIVKGIGMAIGKLVLAFIVIVIIAAIIVAVLVALGFSATIWGVIGVIGGLVLAGMFLYSLYKRSGEGVGGIKLLGVALADTFGVTDIYEGATDKSIVDGKILGQSAEDRSERVTTGVLMIVLLVVGARGGPRTKVPSSIGEVAETGGVFSKIGGAIGKGIDGLGKLAEAGGKIVGEFTGANKFASSKFVAGATAMLDAVASKGGAIVKGVKEFFKPTEEPVKGAKEEGAGVKTKEEGTGKEAKDESTVKDKEAEVKEKEAKDKAQREAEEQAKREAEEKAQKETEEKAKREAEEKAKKEAEEKAKKEAEEKAKKEKEKTEEKPKEKTKGTEEEQLTDIGAKEPVPLTPEELIRVGKWSKLRNQFLKKWREMDLTSLSDEVQALLKGTADKAVRKNMSPDDLAACIKEKRGVKIMKEDGVTPYKHLDGEWPVARKTLLKNIKEIKTKLTELKDAGDMSSTEYKILQERLSDLSKLLDAYGESI